MVRPAGWSREEDIHTGKRRWSRTGRNEESVDSEGGERFSQQHVGMRRLVQRVDGLGRPTAGVVTLT